MRKPLIDAAVIFPALAALGAVGGRTYLGGAAIGHGSVAILAGAIVYLAVCVALRDRHAALPRLALLAWSSVLCIAAGTLVRPALRAFSGPDADEPISPRGYRDMVWLKAYLEEAKRSERPQWQSYVYWRRKPFAGKYINIDEDGLRRTWNAAHDGEDAVRVFMFGGSTMWGRWARDEHTIASLVSRELADAGHRVHVTNFSEDGYVSTQSLIALILKLRRGDVPDIAVLYSGVNDVLSACQQGQAGVPFGEADRRREYAHKTGQAYEPTEPHIDDDRLGREVVDLYLGNVRVLNALAREYNFRLLCYWQPVAFVGKQLTAEERTEIPGPGSPGEWGRMYRFFTAVYAIIRNRPLPDYVRNLSDVFESDTTPRYIDFCHLAERGNAAVADVIAEDIVVYLSQAAGQSPS